MPVTGRSADSSPGWGDTSRLRHLLPTNRSTNIGEEAAAGSSCQGVASWPHPSSGYSPGPAPLNPPPSSPWRQLLSPVGAQLEANGSHSGGDLASVQKALLAQAAAEQKLRVLSMSDVVERPARSNSGALQAGAHRHAVVAAISQARSGLAGQQQTTVGNGDGSVGDGSIAAVPARLAAVCTAAAPPAPTAPAAYLSPNRTQQCKKPCTAATPGRLSSRHLRLVSIVLAGLVVLLHSPGLVYAGIATGTDFPFEECVSDTRNSWYTANFYSYRENRPMNTSTVCIQINLLATCTPGKWRCCSTGINKLKIFPAPGCRGSVSSALVNGNQVTSFYWETHSGYDIVKVTPLVQWLTNKFRADGAILCLNLQAPCWELPTFVFSGQVLEYSFYDKKKDGYECCPTSGVSLLPSEPGFPSRPPPRRQPPAPPFVPDEPTAPTNPGTTPKKRKSPPPSPPSFPPPQSPSPPPPATRRPLPPKAITTSPLPPPAQSTRSPPPSSFPPPSARCNVTTVVRRSSPPAQAFSASSCSMFGSLVLVPLAANAVPPSATYRCSITDASNMILTITLPVANAVALFSAYRDPVQRQLALRVLGLATCGTDYVMMSSDCPGVGAAVSITCPSPPPPPPGKARPPPPSPPLQLPPPSPRPLPKRASPPPPSLPLPPPPSPPPQKRKSPPPSPPPPSSPLLAPPPPRKKSPPPPPPAVRQLPPPTLSWQPPPPLPLRSPPPSARQPTIFVYETSAYVLIYQPSNFANAEANCKATGGHLAAINSEAEGAFITATIIRDLGGSGSINTWFGLIVRTDTTAAIPGFNTDGSTLSYIPDDFQYDRLRMAVRYYMLSCSVATGACAWRYSPGGATDVHPSFLCEITT